jgi:hypothetical protein
MVSKASMQFYALPELPRDDQFSGGNFGIVAQKLVY